MLQPRQGNFWQSDIGFYLDGVSFARRANPHAEARVAGTMRWCKAHQKLTHAAQGEKEGSGGKMAKMFVANTYSNGVILCKQYTEQITRDSFAASSADSSVNVSHTHSFKVPP